MKEPSSALSGTFSHPTSLSLRGTGEGDNLKQFCLRPSEGWEKQP